MTSLQIKIIEYLIALEEGRLPPRDIAGYFAAFDGAFNPTRDFTLHAPTANELVLFYNMGEGRGRYRWMAKGEFTSLCRQTSAALADIADYCLRLVDEGCLKGEYQERERREINAAELNNWRRYQDFYPTEIAAIRDFRSLRFRPEAGLYRLWESVRTGKAAGE